MGLTLSQEVDSLIGGVGDELRRHRYTEPLPPDEQERLREAMMTIANWSRGRPLDDDGLEFLFAETWPPRPEPPTPAAAPSPASR